MEIHQLLYVVTASKYSNFTKAAKVLNISQPSLSNQIIKLEDEFNIKLFERRPHKVSLTAAGQDFVKYATKILNDIDNLSELMQNHADYKTGSIKLGALSIMLPLGISDIINDFHKIYPNIKIDLKEAGSSRLWDMLTTHEIDIGFLLMDDDKLPNIGINVKYEKLMEDSIMVALSKDHRLVNKEKITYADLEKEKLIVGGSNFNFHNIIIDSLINNGIKPNIVSECEQIYTSLQLANDGLGITFISEPVAKFYNFDNLKLLPMIPEKKRSIFIVTLDNLKYLPLVEIFYNFVLNKYI
ncbi:MAG TPA: LysR family transcriptional regulator [Gallicola sp.]|nr:LysR family transcriptional regulator [Gallicola sp.]